MWQCTRSDCNQARRGAISSRTTQCYSGLRLDTLSVDSICNVIARRQFMPLAAQCYYIITHVTSFTVILRYYFHSNRIPRFIYPRYIISQARVLSCSRLMIAAFYCLVLSLTTHKLPPPPAFPIPATILCDWMLPAGPSPSAGMFQFYLKGYRLVLETVHMLKYGTVKAKIQSDQPVKITIPHAVSTYIFYWPFYNAYILGLYIFLIQ